MKHIGKLTSSLMLVGTAAAILGCLLILPTQMLAQAAGNNDVYNTSGGEAASSAFIDAYAVSLSLQSADLCDTVYKILKPATYSAAIIDARGFSGTALTCTQGTPWNESSVYLNKASTILLPAGTIGISTSWVLPNGTRLIGEGSTNSAVQTTIQASTSFPANTAMIQFGDNHCPLQNSVYVCNGIGIESLTLMGSTGTNVVNGILNQYSQELSYVDHVGLYQIPGIGLNVSGASGNYPGSAQNSGPYSNITFDIGTSGLFLSSTVCAEIQVPNGGGTRGIHGLTCIATPDAEAAVYLDSSNNSLEDVRIVGFLNGVYVGSHAAAQNNVLVNVFGNTIPPRSIASPVYVIHVTGTNTGNLAIIGAGNGEAGTSDNTIQDDLTGTTLQDASVAMYVLGEPVSIGGGNAYSRYTTSPSANVATWAVGSGNPTPGTGCGNGSLYSNTSATGSGTTALWVCTNNASNPWGKVK